MPSAYRRDEINACTYMIVGNGAPSEAVAGARGAVRAKHNMAPGTVGRRREQPRLGRSYVQSRDAPGRRPQPAARQRAPYWPGGEWLRGWPHTAGPRAGAHGRLSGARRRVLRGPGPREILAQLGGPIDVAPKIRVPRRSREKQIASETRAIGTGCTRSFPHPAALFTHSPRACFLAQRTQLSSVKGSG